AVLDVKEPVDATTAGSLKAAFARGFSLPAAAVFLEARDAGLGWEEATQAVASGLGEHYGVVPRPTVLKRTGLPTPVVVLASLVVYVVLRPLLGFGHEVAVAGLAAAAHLAIGTGVWEPIIRFLGLDPIYAGAAI